MIFLVIIASLVLIGLFWRSIIKGGVISAIAQTIHIIAAYMIFSGSFALAERTEINEERKKSQIKTFALEMQPSNFNEDKSFWKFYEEKGFYSSPSIYAPYYFNEESSINLYFNCIEFSEPNSIMFTAQIEHFEDSEIPETLTFISGKNEYELFLNKTAKYYGDEFWTSTYLLGHLSERGVIKYFKDLSAPRDISEVVRKFFLVDSSDQITIEAPIMDWSTNFERWKVKVNKKNFNEAHANLLESCKNFER